MRRFRIGGGALGRIAAGVAAAAALSDVMPPGAFPWTGQEVVDEFIATPFHRFSILDPDLRETGFALLHEGGLTGVVLQTRANVVAAPVAGGPHELSKRELASLGDYMRNADAAPQRTTSAAPVMFPADGTTVALRMLQARESPDALAPCGFTPPTGLPITIQFGAGEGHRLESHSLTASGVAVEHCAYDAGSYTS